MKKTATVFIAFIFAIAGLQCVFAQDNGSTQSAPSSQTTIAAASNDGELTQQLQTRFGEDPAFANVQVSVTHSTATITGSVPAKADKKRAKDLAKSISGVKHVKDELTINPSAGKSNNSDNSNKPTDASLKPGSNANSAATASTATNPGTGEVSATSNNPNSQASSTTGAPTATSSASAASTGAGENASSAPRKAGNAANENNMAGQGSVNAQSSGNTPSPTGASANPPSTQPTVGSAAIGANAAGTGKASPSPTGDMSISDTASLQGQIQTALQNEPTLRNDNVNVTVTDNTIELSGSVQNGKEKETARRIASSFAGNRSVKDRITLSGKGSASSSPNSGTLGNNPAANQTNPRTSNNPNPQNPSANNPAGNGDASTNPR